MLDPLANRLIAPILDRCAKIVAHCGISPDSVTITGFFIGMTAIPLLWQGLFIPALIVILINRIFDGLDGALARRTSQSDAGAFLDITFDFIFYSGVVLGIALYSPHKNAIFAALLIFSFMGTGASFLAFSIMATKQGITDTTYKTKSMVYLEGLTEGTETILFFILFTLFPDHFPSISLLFSILCGITTTTRIMGGYRLLKRRQ